MHKLMHRPMHRRGVIRGAGAAGLALWASPAWSLNDQAKVNVPLLRYRAEGYDPRPSAIRRMLLEIEKQTSVMVDPTPLALAPTDKALMAHPLVFMAGEGAFGALSDEAIDRLRLYLRSGGMLVVDSTEGLEQGPFMRSVRRELARLYPDQQPRKLPSEHVIYKSFFLVDKPYGRIMAQPHMDALHEEDRAAVILSYNDMLGAWARDNFGRWEYDTSPGGERQRELSFRLGMNLVMYALCIDYKEDQVHIPFILKRRKWRVD